MTRFYCDFYMSFQDDQRAEILRLTAQMSFEYFRVLDTGPGTVGLAEMEKLESCPPSHGGGWKVTLKCREWGAMGREFGVRSWKASDAVSVDIIR